MGYRTNNTFDIVIASMVFCTIPDVETGVREVSGELKLGGAFRFFEYVADDGWPGCLQPVFAPVWKRLAGGCLSVRQTASRFAAELIFDIIEIDRLQLG